MKTRNKRTGGCITFYGHVQKYETQLGTFHHCEHSKKQLSFINLAVFDNNVTDFMWGWNFINKTHLKKFKLEIGNFDREMIKNIVTFLLCSCLIKLFLSCFRFRFCSSVDF